MTTLSSIFRCRISQSGERRGTNYSERLQNQQTQTVVYLSVSGQKWNEVKLNNKITNTYIRNNGDFSDSFKDVEPDTKILSSVSDRASCLTDQLVGIDSNLEDIVGKGKEGGQWESSHENRDKPELNDCYE